MQGQSSLSLRFFHHEERLSAAPSDAGRFTPVPTSDKRRGALPGAGLASFRQAVQISTAEFTISWSAPDRLNTLADERSHDCPVLDLADHDIAVRQNVHRLPW